MNQPALAIRLGGLLALALLSTLLSPVPAMAQGTTFVYQGRLQDRGEPASGDYDLRFGLHDALAGGNRQGPLLTNTVIAVSNGLFTVGLDFGAVFNGAARWLEIGVRPAGSAIEFTTLEPRQPVAPTPYAMFATTAGTVPNGAITSAKLAAGAAAANLQAGGQAGVAAGGVLLSEQEFATNLLTQGYVRLGKVDLVSESWRPLTNGPLLGDVQVPARRDHASVWTGSELFVWGGRDSSGPLNSGGRYNPSTDTWTPMSTSNAPSPQTSPIAAWTGTHLIVWGNSGPVRGGRYDPISDTWLTLSETNAPGPRSEQSTIWTGTHLILWGGLGSAGYLNSGARYDPVLDAWSAVQSSGAPAVRGRHSAVWTGTEMIIWGGKETRGCGFLCSTSTNYNDGARYNPASNTWQPMTTTSAPLKRFAHTAVWTGTEMIIWGGLMGEGTFAFGTNINSGARYNPTLNQWTAATSATGAPAARDGHQTHWTGSRMLVWGGAAPATNFTDGVQYNPANNTWSAINSAGSPPARAGYGTVWTGTQLLVWGGESIAQPGVFSAIGSRYAPAPDSWSAMAASGDPSARADHTALWATSEMLVWGGMGGEYALRSGGRLNPSKAPSNSWSSIAITGSPGPRTEHSAVWTGTAMIPWGGFDNAQSLNTGGRYFPASNAWSTVTTTGAPTARGRHVAVWTGIHMVIWGGTDGTNFLATGGRYNPVANTWVGTAMATANAPTPRADATAVWTGTEMLVWGGWSVTGGVTNFFNTGGRYDPIANTWQPLPTNGAPAGGFDHTAVWSGTEMIVWGGQTPSGPTNAGARYQRLANTWSPLPAIGAPAARSRHSAVWAGTQMILWGGFDGTNDLASGARYDPVRDLWNVTPAVGAPPSRQRHSAVWSGTEMIVWGGLRFEGPNTVFRDDASAYTPPRTMFLYLKP